MCFRKAAVVVPLLQGLTEVQIAPHSQFAVKMGFPAGLLEARASDDRQQVLHVIAIENDNLGVQ